MGTDDDILGEAHDAEELVTHLRARKQQLELSDATVDDLAGLTAGHTGKLLGPSRAKSLGAMSLSALLGVLALKLVVVVDREQEKRIGGRWQRRDDKRARPAIYRLAEARTISARKAVMARWENTSRAERKAISKRLHLAKSRKLRTRTQPDGA